MSDYAELKRLAEAVDGDITLHAYYAAAQPELILSLLSERASLRGSCKAMGSKNIEKTIRENKRLKELVARFQESAKITAEATDAANRFGENMEQERDQLKAENEALRKALRPLLAHWDDLKSGESINVDAARSAMSKEP